MALYKCVYYYALTLLVGWQEGHLACKKLDTGMVIYLEWGVVPEKGPLNGCVCVLLLLFYIFYTPASIDPQVLKLINIIIITISTWRIICCDF